MHGKIIQYAGTSSSSTKDKTSNTGSTTSKSSKSSNKPHLSSKPASKAPISSNNNFGSSGKKDEDD